MMGGNPGGELVIILNMAETKDGRPSQGRDKRPVYDGRESWDKLVIILNMAETKDGRPSQGRTRQEA